MVYLSIMTMFKNEEMNMKVWLDHYRWQGVESFYMIDNGSEDDSSKIVLEYKESHPDINIYLYDMPEKHAQLKNYKHIFDTEKLNENTNWLIICDLDEFFYTPTGTIYSNLSKYENYKVILCKWRMFGSNGYKNHPKDIRLALTTRVKDFHSLTKYIIQTKYIDSNKINIHFIDDMDESNIYIGDNDFPLNHYPIQSEEFFRKVKMTRGDVSKMQYENVRDMNYF